MQRLKRLLTSASFRLAALQTLLLLITFVAVGVTAIALVRRAEHQAAHAEIEEYEDDLTDRLAHGGVAGLVAKAERHRETFRDFRIDDGAGRLVAGRLPAPPEPKSPQRKFWSTYSTDAVIGHPGGKVLAYSKFEPGSLRLTVGEFLSVREGQDDGLLFAIVALAGGAAAVGLAGGVLVSWRVLRRIDDMAEAVVAYADGNRSARIRLRKRFDQDHANLVQAINSMMDRENRLIEGLRQVSSAIAHDLRRPLSHHNQEITEALQRSRSAPQYRAALLAASARVEEVLQTFQALLHIAELEAGAPGLQLGAVELNKVVGKIVDAYVPAAEAGARRLAYRTIGPPSQVLAEPRVLGRAIANLVENALAHTPVGTVVTVTVEGARIDVVDDGPGVPAFALTQIFDRFFRLDASRSTPGNGLGLSLAQAAMQAFGGTIRAENTHPGLRVSAIFPVLYDGASAAT